MMYELYEEYEGMTVTTQDTGEKIDLQEALITLDVNGLDSPTDHGYDPLKVLWFRNDAFLWDVNKLDSDDPWYGLSWMV